VRLRVSTGGGLFRARCVAWRYGSAAGEGSAVLEYEPRGGGGGGIVDSGFFFKFALLCTTQIIVEGLFILLFALL